MALVGVISLLTALGGCVVCVACMVASRALRLSRAELAETLGWGGRIACLLSFAGLTVACGVLVACFFSGNLSIQYVLDNFSHNTSDMAWLYRLSGLWAGRQGSLLLWAWMISLFGAIVALRRMNANDRLDGIACAVVQMVLAAFVSVMLFSESNMPFTATGPQYYNADGTLNSMAGVAGMNTLLEHWAMAIHPPTLFVGYAGLTVPFAYAVAALASNDFSRAWVEHSTRFALVSWLFLTLGIGLGAVWAYVVLGWGGYWGWDPVENASLLAWIMCAALVHSFSVYRQRGCHKGWAILFACLAFTFVIVGTFISRSGLVQSVHAFEGDPVSLVLFGVLIVVSAALGIAGVAVRRSGLAPECADAADMLTRDGAYFVNSVFLLVMTCLLTYMTMSSALPSWLPFGGQSLSAGSYNAIARPLGILYLLMVALVPVLGWGKTESAALLKRLKVPALLAAALFALLTAYFCVRLLPAFNDVLAAGGSAAQELLEQGPPVYYNVLAIAGFAVASLLFFTSLGMGKRAIGAQRAAAAPAAAPVPAGKGPRRFSMLAGSIAHAGLAILLVGLVGSSMYVTERADYLGYDAQTGVASGTFAIRDYELSFVDSSVEQLENGDVVYAVQLAVARNGADLGTVNPSVQITATQQQKLNAAVIGSPLEDLFVVYRGVSAAGDGLSLDVRVNPLIAFVWAGFAVFAAGVAVGLVGRRCRA